MKKLLVALLAVVVSFPMMSFAGCGASGTPRGNLLLNSFDGGLSEQSLFYAAAGNNSTTITIPKNSTILGAAVNISARPLIWNESFSQTTRDDFNVTEKVSVDIDSSPGDVSLPKPHDDTFDNNFLDGRWRWYNPPSSYDEGNITPGWLRVVSAQGTDFWQGTSTGHFIYQNISNSFTISTRVNGTPAAQFQRAGLMMMRDGGTWMEFSFGNFGGVTNLFRINTSAGASSIVTMPLPSSGPVWLSMSKGNTQFTFWYSTDGNAWSQWNAANASQGWNNPVMSGISVTDGNAGINYTADFDYFWVNRWNGTGYFLSEPRSLAGDVTSAQLSWTGSTPQWCYINVQSRTSFLGPWDTATSGVVYTPGLRQAMFQYNVSLVGPFANDNTPVLNTIWGNITVKDSPANCSLDIGGDGVLEWSQPGPLSIVPARVVFYLTFGDLLDKAVAGPDGNVTIPLTVHSDKKGWVVLSNLTVEYVLNRKPGNTELRAPSDGFYSTTLRPDLTMSATDSDGGVVWLVVEFISNGSVNAFRTANQRANNWGWSAPNCTSGESVTYTPPAGEELPNGADIIWRARAFDGYAYGPWSQNRSLRTDNTPPAGHVTDDGNESSMPTALHAALSFSDGESGVSSYQVKLGTAPNASDTAAPASVTQPDITLTNLTLVYGRRYYVGARALNGAGLWSPWMSSDGIMLKKGIVNHLPWIRVDYPSEGLNLTGIVRFRGSADDIDFLDVLRVQILIDGGAPVEAEGNFSWNYSWDSSTVSNGKHTLTFRAFDLTEYSPARMFNVTVENKKDIEIVAAEPAGDGSISENLSASFRFVARDPKDRQLRYQWFLDGTAVPSATGQNYTYRAGYLSAGVHIVRATAFFGPLEANRTWTLTVTNVNRPPTAVIFVPSAGAVFGQKSVVGFDAAGSGDPDTDDVVNFTWDFGDGTAGYGPQVTHAYSRSGKFKVSLRVSDGYTSAGASADITVKGVPAPEKDALSKLLGQPWFPVLIIALIACPAIIAVAVMRRKKPAAQTEPGHSRPEQKNREATVRKDPVYEPLARRPRAPPQESVEFETAEASNAVVAHSPKPLPQAAVIFETADEAIPEATALPLEKTPSPIPKKSPADTAPEEASLPPAHTTPSLKTGTQPHSPEPRSTTANDDVKELGRLLTMLKSDAPAPEKDGNEARRAKIEPELPKEAPKSEPPKAPEPVIAERDFPKPAHPKEKQRPEIVKEEPKPDPDKEPAPPAPMDDTTLLDMLRKLKI